MFAPCLREKLIDQAARRNALQNFLELALGIDLQRFFFEACQVVAHLLENEPARRREITVEVDRAQERFESVAEVGIALPAAARIFPAAHQEMLPEIEPGGMHFEGLTRDKAGALDREATFTCFAVAREEMFGDDELQDGVTQELEALVVEMFSLLFVGDAGMGQGLGEET